MFATRRISSTAWGQSPSAISRSTLTIFPALIVRSMSHGTNAPLKQVETSRELSAYLQDYGFSINPHVRNLQRQTVQETSTLPQPSPRFPLI